MWLQYSGSMSGAKAESRGGGQHTRASEGAWGLRHLPTSVPSAATQAKQKLSESEALSRLQPGGAPLDPNVLRAAALSSVDPTHMQRVLYFVLKLASCLGRGGCSS